MNMNARFFHAVQLRGLSACAAIAALAIALTLGERRLAAMDDHPLKGDIRTTFTLAPTGFNPETNVLTASVHVEGGGRISGLGNATQTIDQTVMLNLQTLEGPLAGISVITAANGDQLRGFLTGATAPTGVPGVSSLTGTFVFSGGTGRFAGAVGSAAFSGAATFTDPADPTRGGTGYFTLDGALIEQN